MDNYTVEDTNAEAMASKLSAVHKGYFQDNFAEEFIHTQGRKDIIIHRGYWSRRFLSNSSKNDFSLQISFLDENKEKQFRNFLANINQIQLYLNQKVRKNKLYLLDVVMIPIIILYVKIQILKTLIFIMLKQIYQMQLVINSSTQNKNMNKMCLLPINQIRRIEKSNKIKQVIGEHTLSDNKMELYAKNYSLYPSDLTKVEEFKEKLQKCGIDFSIPTFIFAECVLSYIESKFTDELLKQIASTFDICYVSSYEMFNPSDPFGKMMVQNFDRKGCPLVGIFDYPTLESQINRLKKLGYNSSEVYNMLDIYNNHTDQNEKKRIERIEMMDEFEEWNIMQAHYFLSLAVKISESASKNPEYSELIKHLKINQEN